MGGNITLGGSSNPALSAVKES